MDPYPTSRTPALSLMVVGSNSVVYSLVYVGTGAVAASWNTFSADATATAAGATATLVNNGFEACTLALNHQDGNATVAATCNWWGDANGPAPGQIPAGVPFIPWLVSDDLDNPVCTGAPTPTATATPTPTVTATATATPTPTATPACAAASLAQLGNPVTSATCQVCVYDGFGARIAALEVDPGTGWTSSATKELYRFADKTEAQTGVRSLLVDGGVAGRTKIIANAGGKAEALSSTAVGNFPELPPFPLDTSGAGIRVQLVNSLGFCWQADFPTASVRRNLYEASARRSYFLATY